MVIGKKYFGSKCFNFGIVFLVSEYVYEFNQFGYCGRCVLVQRVTCFICLNFKQMLSSLCTYWFVYNYVYRFLIFMRLCFQ